MENIKGFKKFLCGGATAANQIEGAFNIDGKVCRVLTFQNMFLKVNAQVIIIWK